MTIHINTYGHGIPLVFFHGWGFDQHIWHPLLPYLSNYQVILVDLPGFGLTPPMEWALFKARLLDRLPDAFHLLGWSMGGLYATRLTIEEPHRVISLCNITSSPRFILEPSWPGVHPDVFVDFHNHLSTDPTKTLNEFVALQLRNKKIPLSRGALPSPEGLTNGLAHLNTWDLREGLKYLTQPISFLFGRLDPITPYALMKAMQELYPKFHYILFNKSAHMPFLSHTDDFVAVLKEFIG